MNFKSQAKSVFVFLEMIIVINKKYVLSNVVSVP